MSKFLTMQEFAEKIKNKRPDILEELEKTEAEYQLVKQIIEARIKKNMTQRELAEKAHLKQFQISKMERGQIGNIKTLAKVADALDMNIILVERNAATTTI